MTWQERLEQVRAVAAARPGLAAWPAAVVAASEAADRAGSNLAARQRAEDLRAVLARQLHADGGRN